VQEGCTNSERKIESMGNVEEVISKYLSNPTGRFIIGQEGKDEKVIIEEVRLLNSKGETTQDFKTGESLTVEIKYFAKEVIKRPFFWIGVGSYMALCLQQICSLTAIHQKR